jgi:hypothetical protein
MYIKTEEVTQEFPWKSKKGLVYYRQKTKRVHYFLCDCCNVEFQRDYGNMDKKRACNDYKHYCSTCGRLQAAKDGKQKRIENLEKKIGQKWTDSSGYTQIYCGPKSSSKRLYPKSSGYYDGSVREHIIVMEEYLGRPMKKGEVVHHIDGDKTNNDISNLDLCSVQEHNKCHATIEQIVFELYKQNKVGYDKKTKRYFLK